MRIDRVILALVVALLYCTLGLILIQDDDAGPSFPVLRGTGGVVGKGAGCTPPLPGGTVDGDLLVMYVETANETAVTVTDFTEVPCSPQQLNGTRLQVFTNQWTTGENLTTTDSGNHQLCGLVGFNTGTYDTTTPIGCCNSNTQAATASKSVTGCTTTGGFDAVLAGGGTDLPDANDSTEFSGEANANLTSLSEVIDQAKNTGNGGAIFVIHGQLEIAGAIGATTTTQEQVTDGANIVIEINPVP